MAAFLGKDAVVKVAMFRLWPAISHHAENLIRQTSSRRHGMPLQTRRNLSQALCTGILLLTALFSPADNCLAEAPSAGTTLAASFDNEIHLIAPPPVQYDSRGGYTFIVFGDTRTAKNDSEKEDKIFHDLRNWTHEEVKRELDEFASFALYSGDFIWRGGDATYWKEIQTQFPASLRSVSFPRLFPVIGNHEAWELDGNVGAMKNYFDTFPYLAQNGVQYHNYAFVIGNSLFVNLCSGVYGTDPEKFEEDDKIWNCKAIESFDKLMQSLRLLYGQLTYKGRLKNIFVTYHKPSYSTYEHPPLNTDNDPVQTLLEFKKGKPDLHIFVFNGHNHVTELFQPSPGVFALVAGGGGAPQKQGIAVNDHGKPMPELFWSAVGSSRYRRINFFRAYIDQQDDISIEERVLCANDDFAVITYFKGVVIDKNGSISYGGSRKYDCGFDQYSYLFK
jgi:hypothetical protein